MTGPKFGIGATVYVPWTCTYTRKGIPCTICAGQRYVTLTLGSGEQQRIECGACGRVGCDPASGIEHVYVATYGVRAGTVTGTSLRGDTWLYEVDNGAHVPEENLYLSEDEATAHARDHMFPITERQVQEQFELNCLHNKRKFTWSAHYHRACLAKLRREAEYHERILLDPRCKERKA